MGKIVTCTVHKGGTGKTTLSVALACYAVKQGLSVAIVDLDSQCNATKQFIALDQVGECLTASDLFDMTDLQTKTVCFVPHKKGDIEPDNVLHDSLDNAVKHRFSVIPANDVLLSVERLPIESASIFSKNLRSLSEYFDLVVCDTPPTKGFGMLAPLMASDYAFSPINPDAFSSDGVASLFEKIRAIKDEKNKKLEFLGLVINRLNTHSPLQKQVANYMKEQLGNNVISQVIAERSAISNSAFSRRPVWYQARSGSTRIAAKEIKNTMKILLDKMEMNEA